MIAVNKGIKYRNKKLFVKLTISLYSLLKSNRMFKKVLSFSFFMCSISWAYSFNVTFRVDMSQQSGFTIPQVSGNFITWESPFLSLTDADGDNIWEGTADLAAGTYEYKFTADAWAMQETLLADNSCTVTNFGYTNRTLAVSVDVVLPVVCWGSCTDCASSPNIYTAVFQVDMNDIMSNVDSVFTTPEVNGTFNSWCGNCNPMTDVDGDGIWSTTITLMEGDYDYKFSHDNWSGQEPLVAGSSCTMTGGGYTNRTMSLTQDTVLALVCYGSCTPCGQSSGPYNVTFAVDMSEVAFTYTTPEVNADFNLFCGSCAPMADPDGDHVYTITIPLNPGTYTYKFSYDNWAGQEELIPGSSCTLTESGFTNRTIEVTDNTVLTNVCWGSCEECVVGVDEVMAASFNVFPNPAQDELNIVSAVRENAWVVLSDMTGRVVLKQFIQQSQTARMNVSLLPAGSYVVTMNNGNELLRRVVQIVK